MNTKFATTLVIVAAALGAGSSSFAYGTSNDEGVWAGTSSAVALNPNGDTITQPAFHSAASRAQVRSASAQNRAPVSAVAVNPQGPAIVAQPTFHAEQSRAMVRQDVAQSQHTQSAIATNPNGDDALPQSVAESRVTRSQQPQRAALGVDSGSRQLDAE